MAVGEVAAQLGRGGLRGMAPETALRALEVALDRDEELLHLLWGERLNLVAFDARRLDRIAHVTGDKSPFNRFVEREVQHLVKSRDSRWRKPFLQLLGVECLEVLWREFLQLVMPDTRYQVQTDQHLVSFIGSRTYRVLVRILQPVRQKLLDLLLRRRHQRSLLLLVESHL